MELGHIAIVWTMYDQIQRSDAASKDAKTSPRPSPKQRFMGTVRRFAFRTQLGPVGRQAAV